MAGSKDRIENIESALAFEQHTQEQLSEQLIRAFETLDRLERRLGALEGRLSSLEERELEGEEDDGLTGATP